MIENILNKRHLTFGEIMLIQNELNKKADPNNPDWTKARTIEDYKLASAIEFIELVESTPWKWWKGGQTDLWNVKIELIDMLHFSISNSFLNGLETDKDKFLGFSDEEVITFELFSENNVNNGVDRKKAFEMLKSILLNNETYSEINRYMRSCGITSNEISSIYVAKYALNEIRWKGGYALDQYKKLKNGYIDDNGEKIDGVEDNVFLESLVNEFKLNENMTLSELRQSIFKRFDAF